MAALKIGDENLHFAAGYALADRLDGEFEEFRAAIFAVVAVDAGHHRVAQSHDGDRFRHSSWLVIIDCERAAFLHGAKTAPARADVAEDHESGGAPVPAFTHIGTRGAFADGMQLKVCDQVLEFAVVRADGSGRAKPFGPAQALVGN